MQTTICTAMLVAPNIPSSSFRLARTAFLTFAGSGALLDRSHNECGMFDNLHPSFRAVLTCPFKRFDGRLLKSGEPVLQSHCETSARQGRPEMSRGQSAMQPESIVQSR